MKTLFSGRSDMPFAMLLLAPSLILLGGLVAWPMISNIEISFLRLPLNPRIDAVFVGLDNYIRILGDAAFWHSLWMTFWYTALVVLGSTGLGLAVAIFFNREFRMRKTARSLVILSYVTPSISLVFAWKYMFNNGYGIVNYLGVDLLHLYDQAPLWFDNPGSSFVLVVLFAIWRYFPYAFISFLAILQTIDKSLYEAAEMDGANAWQRFRIVTLWLPEADAEGVIPQDDTFMAKPAIDLSRYKAKAGKQTILLDYSRAEVNEMQILKQADVVMLNYLLPERFTPQQCAANLAFYEPRTIHDSSLSKAIHGIVLARCGDTDGAYAFWRDGIAIDLGDDPHSSDDGIHAAATGAVWGGAIQGFAGLHISEGELHLAPKLPAHWQKLAFPLRWRGATMHITCEDDQLTIETTAPVTLTLWGKTLHVSGRKVCARKDFLASVNGTATTEGRHDA